MSWQNSGGNGGSGGGGPWGGGPGNNNPWGKRPGNNGGNNGGNGGGPRPPDIEELFKRGQDRVRNIVPGGFGSGKAVGLIVLAAIGVWLASGFYRVEPDQQGVVLRFGSYKNTTLPGLNWHWPAPIETVLKPSVTRDNLLNVVSRNGGQNSTDSLMLTGDENIVDIDFNVLWRIKDAVPFLFSARQPEALIRAASESVMREIIGQTAIQQALTEGRGRIETSARDQIQALVDSYGIGVEIRQVQLSRVDPPAPVVDAFNEVQRARANREQLRNEAEAYRNSILPNARGESEKLLQEAQAYREEVVNRALGDAKRFLSVYESYRVAKDVTARRLYIETMEEILAKSQKVLIDGKAGQQGVQPYMPLPELRKPAIVPPSQPQGARP